jgi:hypothetical protein
MASRPKTVPVIAGFLFVATAIAWVVGSALLVRSRLLDSLWRFNPAGAEFFKAIGPVSGLFLLMLGVGTAAAGRGLLRGNAWAWWFAVILFVVDGAGDVVSFFLTGDWLRSTSGMLISGAFLYALLRPRVRQFFSTRSGVSAS